MMVLRQISSHHLNLRPCNSHVVAKISRAALSALSGASSGDTQGFGENGRHHHRHRINMMNFKGNSESGDAVTLVTVFSLNTCTHARTVAGVHVCTRVSVTTVTTVTIILKRYIYHIVSCGDACGDALACLLESVTRTIKYPVLQGLSP